MGVLTKQDSIHNAAAQLLTPQEEQGEPVELEQESPEEETLEAHGEVAEESTEEIDELSEEEEEVGDTSEDYDQEEIEEEPESTDTEDAFYSVKVDGEDYEVNLEELKKGYQLEKSYTKKSQQLAEEKKELATLKTQLEEERSKYLQYTQMVAQERASVLEKAKGELSAISKDEDPIGYVQKQLEVQDIEQNLNAQIQNYERAQTEQQQANHIRLQQYVQEQSEILASQLEGWNNPEESKAIKEGISKFAKTQGYTDEELSSVTSAKDIIVLNKARMYDELMAKKEVVRKKRTPQKASPKVRSAKPKGGDVKKARRVKAQKEQFNRSGSVKDAQALLMEAITTRKPVRK